MLLSGLSSDRDLELGVLASKARIDLSISSELSFVSLGVEINDVSTVTTGSNTESLASDFVRENEIREESFLNSSDSSTAKKKK